MPGVVVGLQEQLVKGDDGDEQVVDVEAVSAEHAARAHFSRRFEQLGGQLGKFL